MHINELGKILENDSKVFLAYGGLISQALIVSMTDTLEKETRLNGLTTRSCVNILTIFIELMQNIMNYSKKVHDDAIVKDTKGLIFVGHESQKDYYYVCSRNIISHADKDIIEPKLKEVSSLDKEGLKQLYRNNRRSGKNRHERGAGIGFVEIARRCDKIDYSFVQMDTLCYQFSIEAIIFNNP